MYINQSCLFLFQSNKHYVGYFNLLLNRTEFGLLVANRLSELFIFIGYVFVQPFCHVH